MIRTLLGLYLLIDGTLLSAFGHRYLNWLNFESAPRSYNRFMEWQLDQPEWLMRTIGAAMSSFGLMVLRDRGE
jgi:hypothetical protein